MSVLKLFRLKLLAYSAGRLAGSASEVKMNCSGIIKALVKKFAFLENSKTRYCLADYQRLLSPP